MTAVVVAAGRAGSRELLRSVESAARQTPQVEILLAASNPLPVAFSAASFNQRVPVLQVHEASIPAALNEAVHRTRADRLLFLAAPWRLDPHTTERCGRLLDDASETAIVAPALRLDAPDGRLLRHITIEPSLPAFLASPLAAPPAVLIRRDAWESVGVLDTSLGELAWCEWWLRFFDAGARAVSIDQPLARLTAAERNWWPPLPTAPLDPERYRAILERHRPVLDREMTQLVVAQEVRFGRLLARHREALRTRDDLLARLDALRAGAAHHRAFLEHHGRAVVDWGDLRRADPVSRDWGYDRGVPVDRRYIEDFLAAHSSDIRGRVLEVQEDDFTRRFGGPKVLSSEVVDVDDTNPRATIVADLRSATQLADACFDAVILTQTLHVIDDMDAVIAECHRLLAPGGVLLATLPSASRVCLEYGEDGDLWRVTPAGARALFARAFGPREVDVTTFGSVLTNVAFLHGLSCAELTDEEFGATDPYHPLLAGVRARKVTRAARPLGPNRAAVLMYHRIDDQPDVHDLAVPAALLEEQLGWLSKHCRIVTLEELLSGARDGHLDPTVAITFDDGYLDAFEKGVPLIERMGLPVTIFATTRWLQAAGEYWWDTLERAMLQADTPSELSIDLGDGTQRLSTHTAGDRRAAHDRLHGWLVHANLADRDRAMGALQAWAGGISDPRRRPLVADELQRLARTPGVTIGAHGVNHLSLPDQSAAVQRAEILDSVRTLERVLGSTITSFAFPYGAVDRASAELARASCSWSMVCDPLPISSSFDAARVPRLEVKRWDAVTLARQMDRLFNPAPSA